MGPEAAGGVHVALRRFAALVGDEVAALDEAALVMSSVLQPRLDVDHWQHALDELAAACPIPTREGIAEHLFRSGRFVGDRWTYDDWHNSCLDHVLDRGRGIPITLSVVAIEVARRLDVPLVGVGMPAHFLVGDPVDGNWFLDPFHDGRVLDRAGCRLVLTQLSGHEVQWREAFLLPTANLAVVARMLNNLHASFSRRGDAVRLALVTRMRMAISELTGGLDAAARSQAVLN